MLLARVLRRTVFVGIAAMLISSVSQVVAQDYPSKPIRILVGFGPGGTTDTVARLYAQKMSELFNNPVIVVNKPGAYQLAAIRELLSSRPDGYTLYATTGSALVHNPALRRNISYNPLKDFTLISNMVNNPAVIFVNSDLPVNSLAEFVAYTKAHPSEVNLASAGKGTAGHLWGEALQSLLGIKMTHIPYAADNEVVREVAAGTVQLGIQTTVNTVQMVKAGKIKGLAVTTPQRLPYLPDVPSLAEAGVKELSDLHPHTFIAMVGPASMPTEIVTRLNDAMTKVALMPDVESRVRDVLYSEPAPGPSAAFREFVSSQIEKWKEFGKNVELPDL